MHCNIFKALIIWDIHFVKLILNVYIYCAVNIITTIIISFYFLAFQERYVEIIIIEYLCPLHSAALFV